MLFIVCFSPWVMVHIKDIREILTNRPGSPDIPLGPVGPESPGVPYIKIITKTDHTLCEKINKKKMEFIFSNWWQRWDSGSVNMNNKHLLHRHFLQPYLIKGLGSGFHLRNRLGVGLGLCMFDPVIKLEDYFLKEVVHGAIDTIACVVEPLILGC